ncbi:S-layer homology domain-containing protein [Pseudoflavonifractor phocaeensis]|uniref:S-layer homology domain-containing protein n=1 Tax=Pseudoflavonifractor phocaeensis TaxID=1870988 RepID=UPI001F167CCE|nr:S-layer homology domain-containing protein [Pseudoflavonifractor phocaeensis]MCF2660631.1 S-layer homology domain-containing protein [Pseudoflavonifractor phocaeensis]
METTQKKQWWHRLGAVLFSILLMIALAAGLYCGTAYAAEGTQSIQKNLLNGSFEEGQSWSGDYSQPDQSAVPAWNTTAFQGKIELFRKNTGIYIPGVELKPTDGTYAAELNADEESTLYQIVDTYDSSVYEWGLDHGARNGTDIMALVIGPNQSERPSKPSKDGRDQFMQMVDWLNSDANPEIKDAISGIAAGAEPQQYTLYSKKFGTHGSFLDNQGNNAFSLTPSTIYTEEWHIWILSSNKAGTGVTENPWSHFGSNGENDEENASGSQSNGLDLNKYYLYTVPAGQTKTLFGFVSVGYVDSITTADKAKTYGNFVDNINFTLYHPFSGSSTTHGSAVIKGSDGSAIGGDASSTGGLTTYIKDGETLTVQAIVKQADVAGGCEFVGLYYTYRDGAGTLKTDFLQLAGNEVSESATDEEKVGKWIKSTGTNGDITYTYYLRNLTSSVDLHFVFIKNPTITYDPNGGLPYVVRQTGNGETDNNVYSFKPNSGEGISIENSFIAPYVSHAAEGQNDGWKFMGWKLTGDTVDTIPSGVVQVNADKLGSLILPAEHTLACDYVLGGNNGVGAPQYFKIYNGYVTLNKQVQQNATSGVTGVTWTTDNSGTTPSYANLHKGLTMVAQWRWRQAFVPQKHTDEGYVASAEGGTVEITSVTNTSDENYNDAYNSNGGKAYFAAGNEQVTVKATPASGYVFEGWYGEDGKLITTNPIYSYAVTTNSVKTCYARFSNTVTQTYKRQVMDVDSRAWEETTDDTIGTLGRYTYADAVGTPISSTARAGEGYKFVGWYNAEGTPVDDSMLTNDGATISYTITETKTYYARFKKNVAITVTGNSETVTYDGNPHSVSGYSVAYTWNGTTSNSKPDFLTLTEPDSNAPCVTASETNAGTYTMALSARDFSVKNSSGVYAYTLQVIPGKLTINKATRTITATDYNAPYDGEAHGITVTGTTEGDTVTYRTDNATWTGTPPTRTNVQEAKTIWVKVENPNYKTATASATITITKRPVTITVDNAEKSYHEPDPTFTGSITSGSLVNAGDLGTITYSRTNPADSGVGIYQDVLTASYTANGNYEVTLVPGTFTIKSTVISGAAVVVSGGSKVYDGTPFAVTATLTNEATGYTIRYSTNNGTNWSETAPSVTNAAEGEKTVLVKATQTGHVDLVCDPVTIQITKRPITITANSGEKFYDGTALTSGFTYTLPTSTLPHEGLVGGQELTATTTGSLTEIGSVDNTVGDVVIKRDGQDVTENYAITRVDGLLTVKAAEGIAVSKTPAQIEVYAGSDVVWTVTVENNGSHDAKGLTLTDDLEGIAITAPAGIDPADFSVPAGGTVEFTVKLPDAAAGTYVNHVSVTQPKADSTTVKLAEADAAAVTVRTPPAPSTGGNRPTPPTKEETYIMDYRDCTANTACPIWPYTDADAKAWYHDGVHFCLENGLMVGYGDNTFKPDAPTTRSMLIVMLWRLNGSPVVNYALDFDDVAEDAWYTEAVRWAKSEGVAGGYGNGKFGPNGTLTREQMVTILFRYAQCKGYDVSVGEYTNILSFGDATTVAEYAIPAMQWACGSGVVGGKDAADGSGLILDPKGSTTRAQMATMVMRFCAEIVK